MLLIILAVSVCGTQAHAAGNATNKDAGKTLRTGLTLEIAPGPVSKELVVSFPETTNKAVLTITDLKGAKILSKDIDAGSTKANINVGKLDAGTYFVVFSSAEGRSSKLFTKQ